MAVFTPVRPQDARALLRHYDLGELLALTGIASGIENSNFFLSTTRGEYVLTLFEVLTDKQLPFYLDLMHHLALVGLPVPQPQALRQPQGLSNPRLTTLNGKPAAIVTRLPGQYEPAPGPAHCRAAAAMLARVHLAGQDFARAHPERLAPNLRGLAWWQETAPTVAPYLEAAQRRLLTEALAEQTRLAASPAWQTLPRGPAHCDGFRDNVLFTDPPAAPPSEAQLGAQLNVPSEVHLGGLIDFYFAGCEAWLFDVAVCVNDWCVSADGELDPARTQAWLAAYATVRPFTEAERAAWPAMLRAAALRFWLSRLYDSHLPRPAQTLSAHDPRPFERILRARHDASALIDLP